MLQKIYKYILDFLKDKYNFIKRKQYVIRIKKYTLSYKFYKEELYKNFLFDVLSFTSNFCRIDSIKTREIILSLNIYLKNILKNKEGIVKLYEEINLLKIYFDVAKYIYGNNINMYIDIPSDIMDIDIPFLLFQPLIENSIKHGISPKPIGGDIYIKGIVYDNFIEFKVKDTGIGILREEYEKVIKLEKGFGLKITKERLNKFYGQEVSFNIESIIEEGTEVTFKIPKEDSYV